MEHSAILSAVLALVSAGAEAKQSFSRGHVPSLYTYRNTTYEHTTLLGTLPPSPIVTSTPSFQPIEPAEVAFPIHLGVMIAVSLLVGILFTAIYIQLIMVICFGYKLFSYQTVLLFNILLWAALRLTLYSFYYYHCCESVRLLSGVVGWVLVAFPSALQYFSLAVLVRYFGESLFRVFERRLEMATLAPPYRRMRKYSFSIPSNEVIYLGSSQLLGSLVWISSVVAFLSGNIAFYITIEQSGKNGDNTETLLATLRVILLDGLFLLMGITLGVCILLMYTTRAGKDVLEAQRVHKCWPLLMSVLLVGLFLSRAIYNIVAVRVGDIQIFGDGSTFATDMADNEFYSAHGENKYGYVAYFAVLVVWEVIPTYLIVIFFRVKMPSRSDHSSTVTENIGSVNGKHFFENPHRYDEADHLLNGNSRNTTTGQVSIPSIHSLPPPGLQGGYGSLSKPNIYSVPNKYSINNQSSATSHSFMPGTTPPQLFTSPSFFGDR